MRDFYKNIYFMLTQKQKTPSLESLRHLYHGALNPYPLRLPTLWVGKFHMLKFGRLFGLKLAGVFSSS